MKKFTKTQMFESIKSKLTDPDEIAFLEREIERIKASNANRKPTPKQMENEALKDAICSAMESGKVYTISELIKIVPNLPEDFSPQRMSALLKQLKESNIVVRTEIKRIAYLGLAPSNE